MLLFIQYICVVYSYIELIWSVSSAAQSKALFLWFFIFFFILYMRNCVRWEKCIQCICALWKKYLSCICASFFCGLFKFVTYITISRLFQYNYFVSLLQFKPYNALPVSDSIWKLPTYRSNDLSILRSHNN